MGKQWKQWQTLFSWAPEITADGYCRHEIKRCFLLGRKAMRHLDSVLKSRDITLLIKVCIVKALGFPLVMYRCESWAIEKVESSKSDDFELWCWRRLLRVLGQSILKEINLEYSLEGPMLKLQYFGHLIQKADSLEKTLVLGRMRAGGEGDDRGWDGWMASPTQWTWVWVNSGSWWWAGKPGLLQSMGCKESDTTEWTTTKMNTLKLWSVQGFRPPLATWHPLPAVMAHSLRCAQSTIASCRPPCLRRFEGRLGQDTLAPGQGLRGDLSSGPVQTLEEPGRSCFFSHKIGRRVVPTAQANACSRASKQSGVTSMNLLSPV